MIRTAAALIEAMKADRSLRLQGHARAKPSAPWAYALSNGTPVHGGAVQAARGNLVCIRRDWLSNEQRLSRGV